MERVVYILGAGFSASAGIPTIREFLTRAYELHSDNSQEFSFYEKVFERLDQLGHVGTFYSVDLKNIEDVLSMLEMRAFVRDDVVDIADLELFEKFICSVINATTPSYPNSFHASYRSWMQGRMGPEPLHFYASFVMGLYNIQLSGASGGEIEISGFGKAALLRPTRMDKNIRYDVVSLNYDRLLENSVAALNSSLTDGVNLDFNEDARNAVGLAKLHGDAGSGIVVCPTWNKSDISNLKKQKIKEAWRAAYNSLRKATQIRVVGYSLPVLDSYIRYLLKAAIHDSRNLKKIEVLCLDPQHDVEKRYKELVPTFANFKFISQDVGVYLNNCRPLQIGGASQPYIPDLEYAHRSLSG